MNEPRQLDPNERLARNAVIYLIGNAVSKLLQILILPLITTLLTTAEYGYYDVIVTSINLVVPAVTFQITEVMFRGLFFGDDKEKSVVLSSAAAFIVGGVAALAAIMVTMVAANLNIQYPVFVFLNYISSICFTYQQKVVRSERHNAVVATAGVINTATLLAVQAFTLAVLGMKADGMLIANFVSYFVAAAYMERTTNLHKRLSLKAVNKAKMQSMLRLALPLVPNSACWYFVSAGNSYLITMLVSPAANGIYAIANAFSQLLSFVTGVFQMAWQESSIIELSNERRDAFYTSTFNAYMRLLLSAYITLLPLVRLLMPLLVAPVYQDGYIYVPVLLASAVFSAFSQFYGSAYLTFKKTSGALLTTLVAAAINVVVCIGFLGQIGLFAPAIGSAAAFCVQWVVRVRQMRSYFKVSIDIKTLAVLLGLALLAGICYYRATIAFQAIALAVGVIIVFLFNRDLFMKILGKLRSV